MQMKGKSWPFWKLFSSSRQFMFISWWKVILLSSNVITWVNSFGGQWKTHFHFNEIWHVATSSFLKWKKKIIAIFLGVYSIISRSTNNRVDFLSEQRVDRSCNSSAPNMLAWSLFGILLLYNTLTFDAYL